MLEFVSFSGVYLECKLLNYYKYGYICGNIFPLQKKDVEIKKTFPFFVISEFGSGSCGDVTEHLLWIYYI